MNLEQLMAFTITDDHKRQEEVWATLGWHKIRTGSASLRPSAIDTLPGFLHSACATLADIAHYDYCRDSPHLMQYARFADQRPEIVCGKVETLMAGRLR
ncbi:MULTISPECIES: hypothetical protein [unclassified Bradyrhizobium]|uniref:hypothetical protein n=1 Tax=unclassified Bradyrhizobium TaxID=2631580 RepID=UPI002915F96D|nr:MULTISPECIES: hypothetical protein [unclassified Bradyrhizobium]